MKLRLFQIDAFTSEVFSGNPAAVCPLESWLSPKQMQAIAQENNLSETAFFVPGPEGYDLRWFTPTTEVDLCGHATLATAWVVFNRLENQAAAVRFRTRGGVLTVERQDPLLSMDFPLLSPDPVASVPPDLLKGLARTPQEVLAYGDAAQWGYYLAVFSTPDNVRQITPDLSCLARLTGMNVIITAPARDVDFVSRCFAPGFGIDEDPVTGSAHCVLGPYWAKRLGKRQLHARQVSTRGGEIFCELKESRVAIAGRAVCYLEGAIEV